MIRPTLLLPPLLALAALTGCPQQYPDPLASESGSEECGTNALAKLITARALELRDACGPTPVADCHLDAAEAVRAKYAAKFDKWERCP